MSQLGQHQQANENGQKAAHIAENILMRSYQFCDQSVEAIILKDAKSHKDDAKNKTVDAEDYRT